MSNNFDIENRYIQRFIPHREKLKRPKLTRKENIEYTIGLILFFLIFVFLIPYILYKFNLIRTLLVFFLNLDNVAAILANDDGPFKTYFKYLYTDSTPLIGYISQTIISTIVLAAMFLVIFTTSKNDTLGIGLSRFVISIIITFLIPNRYLTMSMYHSYDYANKDLKYNNTVSSYISLIIGIIIFIIFILIETFLLKNYSIPLGKILDKIFNKTDILKIIEKHK